MHNWYYQYVDHVGLYLHASDESHHRAYSYGQEMIVDCSKTNIYIGGFMSIFEINNQNILCFAL